jgi:hypothetical protein
MPETCGSEGKGCTFPVSELRSQAMTGVGVPAGKVVSARRLALCERPHLVALVRAGATFINDKLVEPPCKKAQPEAA